MTLEKILHPGMLVAAGILTGTLASGIQNGLVSGLGFLSASLLFSAVAAGFWRNT